MKEAFLAAVGRGWVTPSEFWRLHPDGWWWLYESKLPPKAPDNWESLYERLD